MTRMGARGGRCRATVAPQTAATLPVCAPALRRHTLAGGGPAMAPPVVHEVLQSPGQPLDADARQLAAQTLGHVFGRVRVHADGPAATSARAVRALAYTVGDHVVFGAGRYAPATAAGRSLLLHELTHVAQQGGGNAVPGELPIGSSDDVAERQARDVAAGAAALPASQNVETPTLRREEEPTPAPKTDDQGQGLPPLSDADRDQIQSFVQRGRVPMLPNDVLLTDDLDANAAAIGEFFFCRAMQAQPVAPYDNFCATTGLVRGTPLFEQYVKTTIKPVLAGLMLTPDEVEGLRFSPADLADFRRLMALGTLPTLPDPTRLVGNAETDVQALGEFFFCRAMESQPVEPYDRFCLIPGLVRGVPFFTKYVNTVIRPAYAAIPDEVRSAQETRARIQKAIETGALVVPSAAVTAQLTQAPAPGAVGPTPQLLGALGALAEAATLRHREGDRQSVDFAIISLVRPRGGLHSEGHAADISLYAFGLPRLPRAAGPNYERYQAVYHFYEPAPNFTPAAPVLTEAARALRNPLQFGLGVSPNNAPPGGTIDAELDALIDSDAKDAIKQAVQDARDRGVFLLHVFPDAPDHVHLSTAATAEELRGRL